MIDWFERAENAVNRLTDTDAQIAELKVKHERDKRIAKRKWSAIFKRVEGSVEYRKAQAETHPEYESTQAAEMTSLLEYEKLQNERDTCDLVIRFWQSWQRAVREGDVR